eukprot:6186173-Pleurochrysis_carterae.AAC.1
MPLTIRAPISFIHFAASCTPVSTTYMTVAFPPLAAASPNSNGAPLLSDPSRIVRPRIAAQEVDRLTKKSKKQVARLCDMLFAAGTGDVAVIKEALASDEISINDVDYENRTALHIAATAGQLDGAKAENDDIARVRSWSSLSCSSTRRPASTAGDLARVFAHNLPMTV